jgi:hypothetical protein
MARVGEEFPLECPACGGDIRLIAFITEPAPIRKILTHLGEPLEPPPISPARGPPTDFTLGSLVSVSLSTVDNTELIWATGLAPGRYALEVSSNTNNVDYGLAWTVVVPEPGTWLLLAVAVAGGVAVRARRRGSRVA